MPTKRMAIAVALVALGLIPATVAVSASGRSNSGPLKIAFLYGTGVNDHGWVQQFDVARRALEKKFGSSIQTTYKTNVPYGPQSAQIIEGLIQDGYTYIVSTEYGYQQYVAQEALKHPDIFFTQTEDPAITANKGGFDANSSDAYFLAGMAMAAASKTNTLGFLDGFPVPQVVANANAVQLGARLIRPHVKTKVIFINSWYDPAKERQAVLALIGAGAGAMTHDESDPTSGQVSESAKIPWVGSQANQAQFAPRYTLTSAMFDWRPYFTQQVAALLAHKWKSSYFFGNMHDGSVLIAPFSTRAKKLIGKAALRKIRLAQTQLLAGRLRVFRGPLKDNHGQLRVAPKKSLSDADIQRMNWFVQGVEAKGATP